MKLVDTSVQLKKQLFAFGDLASQLIIIFI